MLVCDLKRPAYSRCSMKTTKRAPLTSEQTDDAHRLMAVFKQRQKETKGLTQTTLGEQCGWTQGAVWQFMHAQVPLSLESVTKLAKALRCPVADISPSLAKQIGEMIYAVGEPDVAKIPRAEESGYLVDGPHVSYAQSIKNEARSKPMDMIEQALRALVIVGSDKDEVIKLVREKAAKSAEIQRAMQELAMKGE